jgi:mRNA interferase RelE/StbE
VTARYRVLVEPRARKHLASIDPVIRSRIGAKIEALATDPEPPGCKALKGTQSILRIRVGDYRILYAIGRGDNDGIVLVIDVDHRRDIYR